MDLTKNRNRRDWRRDAKKMRRKRIRRNRARARSAEKSIDVSGHLTKLAEHRIAELLAEELIAEENKKQNNLWQDYDRKCMETWCEKQKQLAKVEEAKELERIRIQQEFESRLKRKEELRLERIRVAEEKQRQHEILVKKIDDFIIGIGPQPEELEQCTESNPSHELCTYFAKTGCCRFGPKCKRNHRRPGISRLLLIRNCFEHIRSNQNAKPDYGQDMLVDFDDANLHSAFIDFFNDVLPELEKFGRLTQFRVCRNQEVHLRGNLYVEFESKREALKAKRGLDGRFYAGRQLQLEFCAFQSWKNAVCGRFMRRSLSTELRNVGLSLADKCPKGLECNYLHVFQNPANRFSFSNCTNWATPSNGLISRRAQPSSSIRSQWDDEISVRGSDRVRSHWRWSESPESCVSRTSKRDRNRELQKSDNSSPNRFKVGRKTDSDRSTRHRHSSSHRPSSRRTRSRTRTPRSERTKTEGRKSLRHSSSKRSRSPENSEKHHKKHTKKHLRRSKSRSASRSKSKRS